MTTSAQSAGRAQQSTVNISQAANWSPMKMCVLTAVDSIKVTSFVFLLRLAEPQTPSHHSVWEVTERRRRCRTDGGQEYLTGEWRGGEEGWMVSEAEELYYCK